MPEVSELHVWVQLGTYMYAHLEGVCSGWLAVVLAQEATQLCVYSGG